MATPQLPPRAEAEARDEADELAHWRREFAVPTHPRGGSGAPGGVRPAAYLCGNSLGLMPRTASAAVQRVLDHWQTHAVEGHFTGDESWYRYDEPIAALQAPLVGAKPNEVALANGLTVNLHLLMASFYRPAGTRTKILIEPHAFPSDRYTVASQAAWHGLDPATTVIEIETARPDEVTAADIEATLARHEGQIALGLLGGVNYYTGQLLPLAEASGALREAGAVVGLDLAHAVANVPVHLDEWEVDFAAWCTYKYLNGGPGACAGFFVNERHHTDPALVRLAGWWGNDPATRFDMHGQDKFAPRGDAAGWIMSNPSILALAPVGASLRLFDQVGLPALRKKSISLTGFLAELLEAVPDVVSITPGEPERRGCQLSVRVPGSAMVLEHRLADEGVIVDARDPDIVRLSPAPLYNSFVDCWDAVAALSRHL